MLKIFFFLLLIIFGQQVVGQDSIQYQWKEIRSFNLEEESRWTVDAFENLYVSSRGIINKYDVNGELTFSQSIKSLGSMTDLVLINTMKLVHFSEEQQTLCYFDNTLSELDDCVDLSNEGIVNAFLISSSSQPNKIWILDNFNSTLSFLSLDRTIQSQRVFNLKGVLNLEDIVQMLEYGNAMYLLDDEKGVYQFDLYGSLVQFIPVKNAKQIAVVGSTLYILVENQLIVHALEFNDSFKINLPVEEIIEIKEVNQTFFLRSNEKVYKFQLVFG